MRAQFLFLCIAIIPVIYAWPFKKCPDMPANSLVEISYKQIKGEWKVVASKPTNTKCMNITVDDSSLRKDYYSKVLFFWHKKSSTEYNINKGIKSTSLDLKPKHWYSFGSEKHNLIGANYDSFVLFYSCSGGVFSITENYELWTRDEVDPKILPAGITESLARFNIKPEALTFRTNKDCSH